MRQLFVRSQDGLAFVEVIVVVALVAVVITALISGTVTTLRSTNFTNQKSQATKLAQEGVEIIRGFRDQSWYAFYARRDQTWCISKDGTWTQTQTCPVNIDSTYTRSAVLTWVGGSNPYMNVVVRVSWPSGNTIHQSQIETRLTEWR